MTVFITLQGRADIFFAGIFSRMLKEAVRRRRDEDLFIVFYEIFDDFI